MFDGEVTWSTSPYNEELSVYPGFEDPQVDDVDSFLAETGISGVRLSLRRYLFVFLGQLERVLDPPLFLLGLVDESLPDVGWIKLVNPVWVWELFGVELSGECP